MESDQSTSALVLPQQQHADQQQQQQQQLVPVSVSASGTISGLQLGDVIVQNSFSGHPEGTQLLLDGGACYNIITSSTNSQQAEIVDANGETRLIEIISLPGDNIGLMEDSTMGVTSESETTSVMTAPSLIATSQSGGLTANGVTARQREGVGGVVLEEGTGDGGGNVQDRASWRLDSGVIIVGNADDPFSSVNQSLGDHIYLNSVSPTSGVIPVPKPLPPDCPPWAQRLNDCETIGTYFRGWVANDVELDFLLTHHKQQTQSTWGTRQSPSNTRPSARMMWKSQYVPFDGIPFVNSGSRAAVMECQFGPRRKGGPVKRDSPYNFKHTCPARIYIKKVRKFPTFGVNVQQDKKTMKIAMDQAFNSLRDMHVHSIGEERYYVQLPTEQAHEFHELLSQSLPSHHQRGLYEAAPPSVSARTGTSSNFKLLAEGSGVSAGSTLSRLDPRVSEKVRELVADGIVNVVQMRKRLRKYVEKDLAKSPNEQDTPDKHNLSFFPTVNDLQNHIHCALKDIRLGLLLATPAAQIVPARDISVETAGVVNNTPSVITQYSSSVSLNQSKQRVTTVMAPSGSGELLNSSQIGGALRGPDGGDMWMSTEPGAEVTVHLTHSNGDGDGTPIVEARLSDSTTPVSPETANFIANLPKMLQGGLLQSSTDGTRLVITTLSNTLANSTFSNTLANSICSDVSSMPVLNPPADDTLIALEDLPSAMASQRTAMGANLSAPTNTPLLFKLIHTGGRGPDLIEALDSSHFSEAVPEDGDQFMEIVPSGVEDAGGSSAVYMTVADGSVLQSDMVDTSSQRQMLQSEEESVRPTTSISSLPASSGPALVSVIPTSVHSASVLSVSSFIETGDTAHDVSSMLHGSTAAMDPGEGHVLVSAGHSLGSDEGELGGHDSASEHLMLIADSNVNTVV